MDYVNLGNSGLRVSPACLGAMMFGHGEHAPCDEEESGRIIDAFLDTGGNFIDTANVYTGGESEEVVGRAIKNKRERVVLATKGFGPIGDGPNDVGLGRQYLHRALDASLQRLGTDYIDLYQCHRSDPNTPIEETMATLHGFVEAGKVRYIGCSNFSGSQIVEAQWAAEKIGGTPFVSLQPSYALTNRRIEEDILPTCQRHGLGTMIYSPLGGGVLTGKYKRGEEPPADSRAAREHVGAHAERPGARHRRRGRQGRGRARRHAHCSRNRLGHGTARRHHGHHRPAHVRAVRTEHGGLRPHARSGAGEASQRCLALGALTVRRRNRAPKCRRWG